MTGNGICEDDESRQLPAGSNRLGESILITNANRPSIAFTVYVNVCAVTPLSPIAASKRDAHRRHHVLPLRYLSTSC